MTLQILGEFRGLSQKKSQNGNVYNFVNIEDDDGEGCKFSVDADCDLSVLTKGDKVTFLLDYNQQYKSLKVVGYNV